MIDDQVRIRPLLPSDDMIEITDLLHAAYAPLGARGLRYRATYQTVEETASRFGSGQGLIAKCKARIVGTITVRPPDPSSNVVFYRDSTVWNFNQFGVWPAFQGRGIGRQLHDAALQLADEQGGATIALDTAAPATELIATYARWGYSIVGEIDWRPMTSYLSVIMARPIKKIRDDHVMTIADR